MNLSNALARLLLISVCVTALPVVPHTAEFSAAAQTGSQEKEETGLQFRLSEGTPPTASPTPPPAPAVPAQRLSAAATERLLLRLPPLTIPGEVSDFKLRDRSLPPPTPGRLIDAAFAPPSPSTPPAPANFATPLEVLRVAPEGDVELAPVISIVFSLPMVALSSQDEAAAVVPVTLSPQPAGEWRWLGTQTLVFQPDAEGGRAPMATGYTVTIPAGTASAMGNRLPAAKTFTFATPPPTIKQRYPSGENQPRDATMFLEFDQRVDTAQILARLSTNVPGRKVQFRAATADEIAANKPVNDLVKAATDGRWLAFRTINPDGTTADALPPETTIKITIPAGTPSLEGPRTTTAPQSFEFKTYGPFRVSQAPGCGDLRCSPLEPLRLLTNNQFNQANFDPRRVTIMPALPDAKIGVVNSMLWITGKKQSNTDYTITLDPAIKDIFGQSLSGMNRFVVKVGTAPPRMFGAGDQFVILDPSAKRTFSVFTINYQQVRVRFSRVAPEDWPKFRAHQAARMRRDRDNATTLPPPPGAIVYERVLPVNDRLDEVVETAIDLSPGLTNGYGQLFVQVEAVEQPGGPVQIYLNGNGPVEAWIQATDIALDAFADSRQLVAWTSSLRDGQPLAGVQIQVFPDQATGTTDAGGLARIDLSKPVDPSKSTLALIVARRGNDLAILPHDYYPYFYRPDVQSWRRDDVTRSLVWYVFDDRALYRPGEEVHVKGWIRQIDQVPEGDLSLFDAAGETVEYTLSDSANNEILKGKTKLNSLAGFDLSLNLPPNMNLGSAELEFKLAKNGDEYTHTFRVEEFRRPEFKITAETSDGPFLVGGQATATVSASYFAGGGLPNTAVDWTVTARPTNFTPPGRNDFVFGKFIPWWMYENTIYDTTEQEFTSKTNAEGKHALRLDFDRVRPARPSIVTAEASVQDVNRQTLSATTSMIVHPASVYVGLKPARTFVEPGQPFALSAIVTDLDGKAVAGREVRLRLVRLDYVFEKTWVQKEVDPLERTITSGDDAIAIELPTSGGGTYRLTAEVRDDHERLNQTELSLWVAGGNRAPNREVEQETVELIPAKRSFAPGETADLLVQSPIANAEGLLTLRRSGILRTERFHVTGNSHTLRIPITEGMLPNLSAQVDLVGTQPRVDDEGKARPDLPPRSAFASGQIDLLVSSESRRLKVSATPRETMLEPGSETTVDVVVKDVEGRPVPGTDTTVVVVDESVLFLADYQVPDPITRLYGGRDAAVDDYYFRRFLKLANPRSPEIFDRVLNTTDSQLSTTVENNFILDGVRTRLGLRTGAYGAEYGKSTGGIFNVITKSGGSSSPENKPVAVRMNFNALAVFAASVPTDNQGRAQVRVKLPDNLTRYRVIVVSLAGGKLAGTGEATITARKQLMARPSAPRFLNYGDRAELPIVLQNQSASPVTAELAVRATNAELTDGAGRSVTIPANDRVEIRLPFTTLQPGSARFQVVTAAGPSADAAEVSLPVYTPATTEAAATYGTIDQGSIAQPVKAPANAVRAFGGLEVTTASTQLQELTDAFIYLVHYPFECTEQISSRMMSIAALKDVLAAFKSKDLPPPDALQASVDADIKRLRSLQNEDGGFDFWRKGAPSGPFVSVHVAHALVRAKQKGYVVPDEMLVASQDYLRKINDRIPTEYSPESRRTIRAYALYVRHLMNDPDPKEARRLIEQAGGADKVPLEALGWMLPVLSADPASAAQVEGIRRHLQNRVTETADAAHFADSYSDGAFTVLASDRRADGVLLDALIGGQPQSDLIPKLVRGLLSGRKGGRWYNTQENVFILLALDRYFNTYEKAEPNFTARVWLGNGYAGEQTFKGRSVDKQQLSLPMATLAERTASGPANLTIDKQGPGRLYYRIGTRYAPANLNLAAADYGFRVERSYEAVDDPADVRHDPDGTWHVRAGARIRVRVKMFNPARRYHVALVDPLPAGLEALNPELKGTGTLPPDSADEGATASIYDWWGRSRWFEHENLRDDRVEAFTYLLWEGEHEYAYFARATTPGLFVVPPAKAEEMYAPETFGRGHTDRVRIE